MIYSNSITRVNASMALMLNATITTTLVPKKAITNKRNSFSQMVVFIAASIQPLPLFMKIMFAPDVLCSSGPVPRSVAADDVETD